MYGFIHCALHDLVHKSFGEETWTQIIAAAGIELDGGSYLIHKIYSDEETLKLVGAACEVLGLPLDSILEKFGQHFFKYCVQSGYDRILRVLGRNLREFLCNLDALHDHLAAIYPGMNAPSFRTTEKPDGSLLLHYYSNRSGLGSIVIGIVKTVAKEILNTQVSVEVLEHKNENHDHVIFIIKEKGGRRNSIVRMPSISVISSSGSSKLGTGQRDIKQMRSRPAKSLMTVESFCKAFPFHIIFDRHLVIRQTGTCISKYLQRCHNDLHMGDEEGRLLFSDLFRLLRPRMRFSFDSVLAHINTVFIITTRDSSGAFRKLSIGRKNSIRDHSSPTIQATTDELRLKGQMVYLSNSDCILFLCSPRVENLESLYEKGLRLSDIPIHDATRELVLMAHAHRPARELVEKLEHTTNNLRKLQNRLFEDKQRTDDLLHEILPKKVAARLRLNKPVPAERYKIVTILFSDIVGFTALCSDEKVVPMDIVRLLNKLYTYFDMMSGIHDVYKVETIGDAYMVVGGLPTPCSDHAERVASMACSMLEAVRDVHSPVDSEPIRIRIGLHSGPVMAGVVGEKMPRYCLFGNTVSVANKMESGSLPNKINVSAETRKFLDSAEGKTWEFESNTNPNPIPCYFLKRKTDAPSNKYVTEITAQIRQSSCLLRTLAASPKDSPRGTPNGTPVLTPLASPNISPPSSPKCPFSINNNTIASVKVVQQN